MSDCVINDKRPFPPGEEGLQDHLLMEAIYQAARTGVAVQLAPIQAGAYRGPEPQLD